MKFGISLATVAVAAMLLLSVGCGKGESLKSVYSTNIKKLHQCYTMFMEENNFKGPKDEEELKNYLKTNATAVHLLKRIDITPESVDGMFISDRDGKPFVVRYGLRGVADHAIVFEADGLDGKRLVALAAPIEVDAATYDDYLTGKIEPETEGGGGGFVAEDAE